MAKSTEVAQATASSLSTDVMDFEAFAGAGTENIKISDVIIPRLAIMQALSPYINKKKSEYIEGAEVGDIADVATGDLFKEGVLFLPVYYRKDFLEWAPRESGKGLVAVHPDDSILAECTKDEKGRPITAEGNYIAETAQWYGFNLTAGRRRCFIPMASSQLKRSRKMMTMVTNERINRPDGSDFQAPIFYRSYMMTTAEESDNVNDWSVWSVRRDKAMPELFANWRDVLKEATEFRQSLIDGEAKGDLASTESDHQLKDAGGDTAEM